MDVIVFSVKFFEFCFKVFADVTEYFFQVQNDLFAENMDAKTGYKGYCQMAGEMKAWKSEDNTSFLKLVHSQPLQQTLKDLDRAIRDGFKKDKGFPKFKKKSSDKAFRYPQGVKILDGKVYLPKIGLVKFQESQEIQGAIKNTTVSFYCGHWYVAFQTEFEEQIPHHDGGEIGIDLGVTQFATLSTGEKIESPRPLKKYEKNLAAGQRKLARKKRWKKLDAAETSRSENS